MRGTVIAVWLAACGSSPRTEPIAPSTGAEVVAEPPWELASIPTARGSSRTAQLTLRHGDGWLVVSGGARVIVEGAQRVVAADRTRHAIVTATELGGVWVFATEAGEVYRSATILGDLELVGTMERWIGAVASSEHRLALLDEDGRLWVGNESGIHELALERPVVDASFATPTFGARIDVDGRVYATTDGGTTWREVTLPPDAGTPTVAFHHDTTELVWTATGRYFWIEPPATATSASGFTPGANTGAAIDDESRDLALALAAREYRVASELSEDGRIAVLEGGELVVLPDGTRPSESPGCPYRWWHGRLIASCGGGVFYATDGASPFETFVPAVANRPSVLDPAGDRAVAAGPCADGYHERFDSICVRTGSARRELPFPGLRELLGFSDGSVVGSVVRADGSAGLGRVDLTTGAVAAVSIDGATGPAAAHVADDGTIFVRGYDGSFHVGTASSGLRPITVPADAVDPHLVAIDARHWALEGGDAIFLTSDAGATWDPVPPEDGLDLHPDRCRGRSCDLGSRLWLPEGSSPIGGYREVSAATASETYAAPLLDVALSCEVPLRWAGHPMPAPLPDAPVGTFLASGALSTGATSWTDGELAPRLRGLDGDATFSVRGRAGTVPPVPPIGAAPSAAVSARLLAVTPSVGLLERRRTDGHYLTTDLVAVGPGMAPTVLPTLLDVALTFTHAPIVQGVIALDDGSIAARITDGLSFSSDYHHRPDLVFVVAPDGTVRSHTFESGAVLTRRALAVDAAGEIGIVAVRVEAAHFLPFGGGRAVPIPMPPRSVGRGCTAADTPVVRVVGPIAESGSVAVLLGAGGAALSPVVALMADGTACLESARILGPTSAPGLSELGRTPLYLRIEDGTVEASLVPERGDAIDVACSFTPVEAEEGAPARMAMGTLADGSLGLVGAYLSQADLWLYGHLDGDRFETTTGPAGSDEVDGIRLVEGAAEPTTIDVGVVTTATDASFVSGLVGRVGALPDAITVWVPDDPSGSGSPSYDLVAETERGEIGRLALGDVSVVDAAMLPDGDDGAVGVIRLDDSESGGCTLRGFRVAPASFTALSEVTLGSECWSVTSLAVGGPASRLALGYGDTGAIHVVELGGTSAVERGPPITQTTDSSYPQVLAVTLTPRPRVVYLDSAGGGHEVVRVVELRGDAWHDLAPVWPVWGLPGATFHGGDVYVADSDGPPDPSAPEGTVALPRAARLHGRAWEAITIDPVVGEPVEEEYEEETDYDDDGRDFDDEGY